MLFFYFLKIIFKINTSKRSENIKKLIFNKNKIKIKIKKNTIYTVFPNRFYITLFRHQHCKTTN